MSSADFDNLHRSVLLDETVGPIVAIAPSLVIDATLGLGGHSEAILLRSTDAKIIGIDQDTTAIELAKTRLQAFDERITFVHSNFSEIKEVVREYSADQPDAILADLGVSSIQLDDGDRGFSFRSDAPLDMRMDRDPNRATAADLLAELPEEEIANIIYQYGEERASRKIARWIVEKRKSGEPVKTTLELASLVERALKKGKKDQVHPATRTFQALRIAVNDELGIIEGFLKDSVEILKPGGILAVITFHSLEDRIVKQTFLKMSGRCFCPPRMPVCQCGAEKLVEVLTRKPVTATESELNVNKRSRSAKLRIVKKLEF